MKPEAVTVRGERPGDYAAISEVNDLAFSGGEESALINSLRRDGYVIVSLVAEVPGAGVVGHILFSDLPITGPDQSVSGAALAPMAVHPDWQQRGIGSRLVAEGLIRCREQGIAAVVVVGHPAYYHRFGFSAPLAQGLEAPFSGEAFMALELEPGALAAGGRVCYPPPFGC